MHTCRWLARADVNPANFVEGFFLNPVRKGSGILAISGDAFPRLRPERKEHAKDHLILLT